jgi:hypothetical protein
VTPHIAGMMATPTPSIMRRAYLRAV